MNTKCLTLGFATIVVLGGLLGAQEPPQTSSEAMPKTDFKLESKWIAPLKFRNIGPAFTSGRIGDIALDQVHPNTWYVGVASGGVWKTENAGTTFEPIFDTYGSYSIGCISIDPSNCNTIWVGTGENDGGRHIGFGDGVYRSRDGGKSFENMGLKASEHVSKILIDPRDSNVVFVASQGPLWSSGGERGLFKSTDGGLSWRNVLEKGPYTGVTDVVFDPENPEVMYAATHQRHRTVWALLNTGPESGIYKSTDGGETWRQLANGLPGGNKGKISLGVSPIMNNVVYATVELEDRKGGFFRSEDFGESWSQMSDFVSGGTGPHYYQEIYLDPHRFDVIYHANNTLVRSEDGGKTFVPVEGEFKHVDNHAVVFHPDDPDFVLVGCDGGVYRSNDYTKTWQFFANLPVTQFYKVDVDYDAPFYHVVGGTQDNFTQYGPTATRNVQGITNADWRVTIGGDGHDNAIDPEDADTIYCESQEGFIRRFDRKTGESFDIRPQPEAGEDNFRFNWDSPILISPHSHTRIYFGSRKLHRSDDRGDSWTTISPDLSRGVDRWTLPVMGRVWGIDAGFDLFAMSQYGNITSISESPIVEGLIYVGTDDGLVQVTEDGGENWRKIERFFDVPEGAFVNDIKADRHDADTVYACFDDHKKGDYKPYVLKSSDRGKTWKSLANNLPERHLVWRIEQDHVVPDLLFLGTEFGVFTSIDGGKEWVKLSGGLPTIPVRDLAIQKRENDLVAATFGRGFYVLDDYSFLREMSAKLKEERAHLFPVRRSWWYAPDDLIGGSRGYQGNSYFRAENPTFGSVFTVYLKDKIESLKDKRKEAEAEAAKDGSDVTIPSLEELEAEEHEILPSRHIEISDASGAVVARIDLPRSEGMHRVSWDFRGMPIGGTGIRPMMGPGEYKAAVLQRHQETVERLTEEVTFVVEQMVEPTLPPVERAAAIAFQREANELQFQFNSAAAELKKGEEFVEKAIPIVLDFGNGLNDTLANLRKLQVDVRALDRKLNGNPILESHSIEQMPTPRQRLNTALFGSMSSHGPSQTHRRQFEIASDEIRQLIPEIQSLLEEVKSAEKQLREKGLLIEFK